MTETIKIDTSRAVYIKEVLPADLPKSISAQLPQDISEPLFVVYAADGTPLSLAQNRALAEAGARQYDLEPFSVH